MVETVILGTIIPPFLVLVLDLAIVLAFASSSFTALTMVASMPKAASLALARSITLCGAFSHANPIAEPNKTNKPQANRTMAFLMVPLTVFLLMSWMIG